MWKRSDLYRKKTSAGISNIRAKVTDTIVKENIHKGQLGICESHRAYMYAASKLWNVCNYERQHYKETGMEQYPDWYYQKKPIKRICGINTSQTAQEVCRQGMEVFMP